MDSSVCLLQAGDKQYLYNQLVKKSRSKSPNNSFKWYLIEQFDGKESTTGGTVKRTLAEHKFQTYERHRALYFFNDLHEKGIDLFSEEELTRAYIMVSRYLGCRLREVQIWKPKSHNRYRQFSELIRHLFARYVVPTFMDSAFFDKNPLYAQWFIHLAQGGGVRKLHNCPVKMTAKMAHQFMFTPPQYNVTEALRYAQIMNMGGNERLVKTLLATRLGQYFEYDDFWVTVIRFFIQNPMLEQSRIQPIVDYIQHVKFEESIDVHPLNYNQIVTLPPEMPHFSMKGRSVNALLAAVGAWHRALRHVTVRKGNKEPLFWKAVPVRNFKYREGANDDTAKFYEIEQLVTSPALLKEGRQMHHCVYSYTHACVAGRVSIWSMTIREGHGIKSNLLTIEVNMPSNAIVQVRGKFNRIASESEMKVIDRWAVKEGLSISKWVYH